MNGIEKILWKRGTEAANDAAALEEGEISVDSSLRIRVHDGATKGGSVLAKKGDLPSELSDLTDDLSAWTVDGLAKLSQLTDDVGYWKQSDLTKVSQLENDSGFKSAHCSYCSYCTYCSQCSNCYDCTTVNCTTVQCSGKCNTIKTDCNCDCGDDN